MRRVFLALLISAVIPMSCVLADYIDLTEQGNQAVTKNDLDGALKLYKEAQVEKPGDPLLDYNIGTVLNKQSKYDEALERYKKALYSSDPDFQADAYYNMGNTFFRAQEYADAISAYQKDLELGYIIVHYDNLFHFFSLLNLRPWKNYSALIISE